MSEKNEVSIAKIQTDIGYIKTSITEIKDTLLDMPNRYVTKDEFEPFKKGFVAVTMAVVLAFVNALLDLVRR